MEAFPGTKYNGHEGITRAAKEAGGKDQIWYLENVGGNKYHIKCDTENRGARYLEAFPKEENENGLVRP